MKESLTVTELMKRWGTGRNIVIAAIKAGKLKAFKLGVRKLRVMLADVEGFEQSGGVS